MRATIYLSVVAMLGLIGCGPTTSSNADGNRSSTGSSTTTGNSGVTPVLPDNGGSGGSTTEGGTGTSGNRTTGTGTATNTTGTGAPSDATVGVDDKRADNTSINKRDRDSNAKTPIDQDENQDDINTTANIRKTIVNTDGMSVKARNVKIITSKGKVTLRGPVASDDEKQKIEKFATDVAGEGNVDSQLEVAE